MNTKHHITLNSFRQMLSLGILNKIESHTYPLDERLAQGSDRAWGCVAGWEGVEKSASMSNVLLGLGVDWGGAGVTPNNDACWPDGSLEVAGPRGGGVILTVLPAAGGGGRRPPPPIPVGLVLTRGAEGSSSSSPFFVCIDTTDHI